ncbi:HlyD family secretion protein [Spirosoma sordidisoli]|uniref:HlyD family efflux transporter periplasmic adaptor subunit n=1 Tax=Spirosoma sordidisoli TaxID=2502893 RepID=A0A4Q2UDN2_9BACT|nr:HlyD family efflux transporter periplasmic adaptor subunit [Spirosoma sordidisoli]RYC67303.1 HlyD family efflux transporter periplasmic adaptor subunit [Spirosoma sordidisoli]
MDAITYLPTLTVRSQLIYTSVLVAIAVALASLPFIVVDVSVQASGLVRPVAERSDVKPLVSGRVAALLVRENQSVQAGAVLLRLQTPVLDTKLHLLLAQQQEKQQSIHDLTLLLDQKPDELLASATYPALMARLRSPLYRQQFEQFRLVGQENLQTQQKRRRDVETSQLLLRDKVVARLEHEDKEFALNSVVTQYQTLMERQRSEWQTALTQHQLALTELRAQEQQLRQERDLYTVRASVSGTVSQVAGRYAGSYIQAGETIGIISPDSTLIVECYVPPKDIGLLRPGQAARFQVDAFDYNQWGLIDGHILDIDNDFTIVENNPSSRQPVFRVRCQLRQNYLTLPNGYRGSLKKGMTLRARFVVTQRSLFQLLYDKADDWLNPNRTRQNQAGSV